MKNKTQLFTALANSVKWDAGVPFYRTNDLPIDSKSIFPSLSDLETYIDSDPVAYAGQIVAVVNSGESTAYIINDDGTYNRIGSIGDVFFVDGDGKLRINTDVLLTSDNSSANPTINKHISVANPTDDRHAVNKGYLDNVIAGISKFSLIVVEELPSADDAQINTIYLIRNKGGIAQNLYKEYIYVGKSIIALDSDYEDTPNYNNSPNISTRGGTISSITYSSDITPLTNNVVWGYKNYFAIRNNTRPAFHQNTYYMYTGGWEKIENEPDDWDEFYFNYGQSLYSSGQNVKPIAVTIPNFATNTYYRKYDNTYELLSTEPYDWYSQIGLKYYTQSGSTYVPVLAAPQFSPSANFYFRKVDPDKFDLLDSAPSDWNNNYNQYFIKDVNTVQIVGSSISMYISNINLLSDYIRLGMRGDVSYSVGEITIEYTDSEWEQLGEPQSSVVWQSLE